MSEATLVPMREDVSCAAHAPPIARGSAVAESIDPKATALRRQAILLTTGCAAAAMLSGLLWFSTASKAAALETRETRAVQVATDAHAIVTLRDRPQQATEMSLRQSELLERVARAMSTAGVDANALVSTLPQPPRRVRGGGHAQVANRLVFEHVKLEALIRFCHALVTANGELRVSGLHLHAGQERDTWNADVTVAYWILAPARSP